jgi:hypothetical protein
MEDARVWGDLLQKQQWDPAAHLWLALITTATAAPGSISLVAEFDAARDPDEP